MNVCFIVPALINKAPVVLMLSLAHYLSNKGVRVVFLYFNERVELQIPSGVEIQQVKLFQSYDFSEFDVVHSSLLRPDFFLFLNRHSRDKAVFLTTVHSYIKEDLASRYGFWISRSVNFLWRLFWIRPDCVVVLSNHARKYYQSWLLRDKLRVVYNGRDIVRDASLLAGSSVAEVAAFKAKRDIVMGSYCDITAQKGLDLLIQALARNNRLGLIVVGDGQEKNNLINLSVELGVAEQCLFIPATPNAHQYNAFFDIFAMPSKAEGFGLALIEAALHGKKIICSNIPIFRELFDETCVTYFDLHDPASLDRAIHHAFNDEEKAARANARTSRLYSLNNMAVSYEALYAELIQFKRQG